LSKVWFSWNTTTILEMSGDAAPPGAVRGGDGDVGRAFGGISSASLEPWLRINLLGPGQAARNAAGKARPSRGPGERLSEGKNLLRSGRDRGTEVPLETVVRTSLEPVVHEDATGPEASRD